MECHSDHNSHTREALHLGTMEHLHQDTQDPSQDFALQEEYILEVAQLLLLLLLYLYLVEAVVVVIESPLIYWPQAFALFPPLLSLSFSNSLSVTWARVSISVELLLPRARHQMPAACQLQGDPHAVGVPPVCSWPIPPLICHFSLLSHKDPSRG